MKARPNTFEDHVFDVNDKGRLIFATVKGNAIAKLADHYGVCLERRRYSFSPEAYASFIEDVKAVK